MGKRYYCDYCDRSFKDDVEARKKHITSLQHVRNRSDHYSPFKDPDTILKEEYEKTPCKRYMTMGDCAFGLGCRFSHYTPPMIWELQRLAAMKHSKSLAPPPKNGWPNPQDIIKEYFENIVINNDKDDDEEEFTCPIQWSTSVELSGYSNLPPSMRPVTLESITSCNFSKWGIND